MEFKVIKIGASWCGKCRQIPWENEEWDFDTLDKVTQDKLSDAGIKELPVFLLIKEEDGGREILDMTDKCETRKQVDDWFVKVRMEYLAKYYNYKKSEHFNKIVNVRIKMNLDWNQCPCGGEGRGCISELCHKEIKEQGHCHCNCYLKGD